MLTPTTCLLPVQPQQAVQYLPCCDQHALIRQHGQRHAQYLIVRSQEAVQLLVWHLGHPASCHPHPGLWLPDRADGGQKGACKHLLPRQWQEHIVALRQVNDWQLDWLRQHITFWPHPWRWG